MQVQAVNRQATHEYAVFEASLHQAGHAVGELRKQANAIRDPQAPGSWTTPKKEEVVAAVNAAEAELDRLKKAAKKYKVELLARGWRV